MHTYQLEKYHGQATRHECPNCHDKKSFTYYVDERGDVLNEDVGICNHVSSCGYHYTPKQYLAITPMQPNVTPLAISMKNGQEYTPIPGNPIAYLINI